MPIKLWNQESDESLTSQILTGWDSVLGGEEHRKAAEDLDRLLDDVLDDALGRLSIAEDVEATQEFKRLWCVGRAVRESTILHHAALVKERRMLLWRGMAQKCWLGPRYDHPKSPTETGWRQLRPGAQAEPKNPSRMSDVFETGFWLQQQELDAAAFTFGGNMANAQQLAVRKSINVPEMRTALTSWLKALPDEHRMKAQTSANFRRIAQTLRRRWPDKGFGSARRPEHIRPQELLSEVTTVLSPVLNTILSTPAAVPISPAVS